MTLVHLTPKRKSVKRTGVLDVEIGVIDESVKSLDNEIYLTAKACNLESAGDWVGEYKMEDLYFYINILLYNIGLQSIQEYFYINIFLYFYRNI